MQKFIAFIADLTPNRHWWSHFMFKLCSKQITKDHELSSWYFSICSIHKCPNKTINISVKVDTNWSLC